MVQIGRFLRGEGPCDLQCQRLPGSVRDEGPSADGRAPRGLVAAAAAGPRGAGGHSWGRGVLDECGLHTEEHT